VADDDAEGVFDVDDYVAPEAGEIADEEEAGYFEDGDLYVEKDEAPLDGEGDLPFDGEGEVPLVDEVEDQLVGQKPAGDRAVRKQKLKKTYNPPPKREPREPIGTRIEAVWSTLLTEVHKVELPGAPDTRLKRIGTVAAIVFASLAVGAGTYLLGRGSGVDVDQARLQGEAAGLEAGAIDGAAQGFTAGFRAGQRRGFRKAYVPAYRLYYKRAYEQAGLDPPTSKQIEVPLP
jgi:hypothetical protein